MALPGSGQLSISSSIASASLQVSFETTQSGKAANYSLANLSTGYFNLNNFSGDSYAGINQNSTSKPDRGAQHSLSEFYSYNHTQNGSCSGTTFQDVLNGYTDNRYSYQRISATGNVGDIVVISVLIPQVTGGPFSANSAVFRIYTSYPFNTFGILVGTPIFSGAASTANSTTVTYSHTMANSPEIFHIVAYATTPIL